MERREFIKKAGTGTAAAIAATSVGLILGCEKKTEDSSENKKESGPAVVTSKKTTTKWRLQTYAGPALAEHVIKPSIDAFNKAANGEMVIELYNADQLVPQGELFRAVAEGTIDAAQSDDDSMAAPVDVAIFAAYFPFASRYSLDVPALWNWLGLNKIWEEAYAEVKGVTWLSTGAWDPCNFSTSKPIRSLADLKGLRVYTFPTGGKFMQQFGVIPMSLPYSDVQMAIQTGELDGVCWSGITEVYTVGWADVCKYYLTNPISGAWAGSYFANTDKWNALPEHLKTLFRLCMDSSHYYRQHWYWYGEANYRTKGGKMQLTTIPQEEWKQVEDAAYKLWDEVAAKSPRCAKVVAILKEYAKTMEAAGPPYRY